MGPNLEYQDVRALVLDVQDAIHMLMCWCLEVKCWRKCNWTWLFVTWVPVHESSAVDARGTVIQCRGITGVGWET